MKACKNNTTHNFTCKLNIMRLDDDDDDDDDDDASSSTSPSPCCDCKRVRYVCTSSRESREMNAFNEVGDVEVKNKEVREEEKENVSNKNEST